MTGNTSMLSYYRENNFNPVPIEVEEQKVWESHFAKRRNLYERHLGIHFVLLRDRSILEFGCNSGENSLVLAAVGDNLTLVEPHSEVMERLTVLFERLGLRDRIVRLVESDIQSFKQTQQYDVVLAEGFLFTLPDRVNMLKKIVPCLSPGSLAVISFQDRYGSLLEMTRSLVFWRSCELEGVRHIYSQDALDIAEKLYLDDFMRMNASRPFRAWWKDNLASPFLVDKYHWSYAELVPFIQSVGAEIYATSPQWNTSSHYMLYKQSADVAAVHERFLFNWRSHLMFFLTGFTSAPISSVLPGAEVIDPIVG